jgi:hypothetical protein
MPLTKGRPLTKKTPPDEANDDRRMCLHPESRSTMPRKGIFLVLSRPNSPEEEEAYNTWYNEHHVPDSLLMPGFVKGRRFKLADQQLLPSKATDPGFDYVALYDIDDIDLVPQAQKLLPRLAEISAEFMSPAMDPASVRAFIFEQILETDQPTELPEGVDFPRTQA